MVGMFALVTGCVIFGLCAAMLFAQWMWGPHTVVPPVPRPAAVVPSTVTSSGPADVPGTRSECVPGEALCTPRR
jgi:hypothetical protein